MKESKLAGKARPYFNQDHLNNIDDVLVALETLEHDLPVSELENLRNFNNTYRIITSNVRQRIRAGQFDDPEFIERFDARFAYYYLDALQNHIDKNSLHGPWQTAFVYAKKQNASALTAMALGVNAHVNFDIPRVLADCSAGPQHYKDYCRVNSIIKKSLSQVINELGEDNSRLGPKEAISKTVLQIVYDCTR